MKTEEYKALIGSIIESEFGQKIEIELTRPEEQFGDFSTNIALKIAAQAGKAPREVAQSIVDRLKTNQEFVEITIAGPGFINLKLKDSILFEALNDATSIKQTLKNKSIVTEYSDPNPFKVLHAGHLYTTLVGDAISNILESAGGRVHRTNFGGDVGLHAAKAIWGILKHLDGENPEKLKDIDEAERADWLSGCYVTGNQAYDDNKAEIDELNKKIYQIQSTSDQTSPLAQIYWTCRQWSYDGFKKLYDKLNVKPFERYYPESETVKIGLEKVQENTGNVYEESDGAIIYRGEKDGLFTQVFINSEGLPTYAGKDVGLILLKERDFSPDISYIITDVSQKDHLSVVMKSIEKFEPRLVANTIHQTHGRIKLPGGKKMSSREGSVVTADEVIEAAKLSSKEDQDDVVLGAVRYSFLKNSIGGDIIYNPEESVSHEGNSGPYLQYALVRANSILRKLEKNRKEIKVDELDEHERSLARALIAYTDAFDAALTDYSPHHICNYLYDLAQIFNRFYENSRVIDDPRAEIRSILVRSYQQVLSHGLDILGMPKPEKM